jgi:alpha-galactosidase
MNMSARLCGAACLALTLAFHGLPACAAPARALAATPPMGWNDWAHYQCGFTAQTILENAHALVNSGLARRGYDTVTIDDCWMLRDRGRRGNLQPDPKRFPYGMRGVAKAVHAMGLKFGIYEDAGYATCGGFAGSGEPKGGGAAHFLQDARLFASWGVDYLKLDGCNVFVRKGETADAAYRLAYEREHAALERVGRPIVFSESAPAYFQGAAPWYDVLSWVRNYGQLWREGDDIATYDRHHPDRSRFASVLWNYTYNLPLGRFQSPGHWNDPDFIIGGDAGMSLAETRSQLALWSMMSAPLILSSDLTRLSPAAIAILGNRAVLAVDQDPRGRMATLLRRDPASDVLLKPLQGGEYALAVLNRGAAALSVVLHPGDLGLAGSACRLDAANLWTGAAARDAAVIAAAIAPHDTAIWRVRPGAACATRARAGTITRSVPDAHHDPESDTRCLAAPGRVQACVGTDAETWIVTAGGALRSGGECLTATAGHAVLRPCRRLASQQQMASQQWRYGLSGNIISRAGGGCLTAGELGALMVRACGHDLASQIWSLPD